MSHKRIYMVACIISSLGAGFGLSCGSGGISINLGSEATYLDQTNAAITISEVIGGTSASVVAAVTDSLSRTFVMKDGQSVLVNGQDLAASDDGTYVRTIQPASEYVVTVVEPSKFVKATTIAPAPVFDITSPAAGATASLSGFTLTWSNPDPSLKVEFVLTQIVNGSEKQRKFGPYTDTGTQTFAATDLAADFFHGKNMTLSITVMKIRERDGISGFSGGTLVSKLSKTVEVLTGP